MNILERTTPAAAGIDAKRMEAALKKLAAPRYGAHALLVLKGGKVVAERYREPYRAGELHSLFSVSKSFTAAAIGFAEQEGLLRLEDFVTDYFPEYLPAQPCENMRKLRIWHLLTLSAGFDAAPDDFKRKYPGAVVIRTGKRLVAEALQMKCPSEFFAGVDAKKDDFLDFAEDYEPVKTFFAGDQLAIFDRAVKLMGIYDDSKTFIVNEEIESIVAEVKAIMQKPSPYGEIFKLPALLDSFIQAYGKVLHDLNEPVLQAIAEARSRVFDELRDKQCKPQLSDSFIRRFDEIREKAIHCNNVATLQNIKVEADALKVRCLNEINAAENKILAQIAAAEAKKQQEERAAAGMEPTEEAPAPVMSAPRVKRAKTISIKSVNAEQTWQIETPEDVKRYITELEKKLLGALEDDTVIHIEF